MFKSPSPQLKQMKELELEKDSLLAGLDMLEQTKNWYQDQICNVTGRQRQMGKSAQYMVSHAHQHPGSSTEPLTGTSIWDRRDRGTERDRAGQGRQPFAFAFEPLEAGERLRQRLANC